MTHEEQISNEEQVLNFGICIISVLDNYNIPWNSDQLTGTMYNAMKQELPYETNGNYIGVHWDNVSSKQFIIFMQRWVSELSKHYPKDIMKLLKELSETPDLAKQLKEKHKCAVAMIKTIQGESPN